MTLYILQLEDSSSVLLLSISRKIYEKWVCTKINYEQLIDYFRQTIKCEWESCDLTLLKCSVLASPGLQLRQTRDALKMTYVFFVVPNEWLYHLCPMSGSVSEGPMSGPFYVTAQ